MRGRITECHFDLAEKEFPGIVALYEAMTVKPKTFLELVWIYEGLLAEREEQDSATAAFSQAA